MSRKHQRIGAIIGLAVGVSLAAADRAALAEPFTVSYTDGGSWNTLYAQGFSPALAPNPNQGLAAGDPVLLDQFQFFKSGSADSAANIRLAILNNIYTNLQGLTTNSASFVGLSTNMIASTSGITTADAITFDFDNLALTNGGEYGAVFVNVGAGGELTPVLVSALHTNYVDVGGGDYHPQTNYGSESQYQFATSNFITTNQFGSFFNGFSYAGDANFIASLLTPTAASTWNAAGSGAWSTPGNWLGGVPNAVGAAAILGSAATASATVTADINVTVGSLTFDNAHGYAINGPNTVTLDAASGNAAITVESCTHVINAPLVLARNTSIAVTPPDSTLTLAALASSPVAVTKDGAGTLVVNSVRASSLAINDGAVIVLPNSLASGTSKVGSLSIAADAKLDLKDNKLITNTLAGGASGGVYSGVQGEVQRASDFGAWDMPGLTTSMPDAAAGLTTIGVSTGAAMRGLGPSDTDTFAGQTITGASTVAMYTYAGDANLDGVIDGGDYGIIDNFAQIPGADSYFNGDFNYDGVIDGGDYGIIDNNIQAQGAPFPTGGSVGLSGVTAIPEPSACVFAIFTAAAALARRRRRSMQCSWACRIIKD